MLALETLPNPEGPSVMNWASSIMDSVIIQYYVVVRILYIVTVYFHSYTMCLLVVKAVDQSRDIAPRPRAHAI